MELEPSKTNPRYLYEETAKTYYPWYTNRHPCVPEQGTLPPTSQAVLPRLMVRLFC